MPLVNYHWTLVANVKRDPFEQAVGFGQTQVGHGLGRYTRLPIDRIFV